MIVKQTHVCEAAFVEGEEKLIYQLLLLIPSLALQVSKGHTPNPTFSLLDLFKIKIFKVTSIYIYIVTLK